MLCNVKLVDSSLWDLRLGGVDHHHYVVGTVTADASYHRLRILLISGNINEREDLFGLLQDLLLAQQLQVVDVCDLALLIKAEDAVVH